MSVWDLAAADVPAGLLRRDVTSGRIAHAYLFSGVAGRLPMDVAMAFAAAVSCDEGGCGTCETCRRIAHRAHPDVEIIEPAGMQLLVDQVRDAIRSASRRPVAGPRRVIVVAGADRMNPTAQNAFLKALEEPPPSTTIVLLAPAPEALLETVRSRCREVMFAGPTPDAIVALLAERGVDERDARFYARIGGGLHRATELATDGDARELRRQVVARTLDPPTDPGEALEAAEWLSTQTKTIRDKVAVEHATEREELRDWIQETKRVADDRLRREQRRAEQDALEAAFDDIASVLRDLTCLVADPEATVLNVDVREDLVRRADTLGPDAGASVIACLSDLEAARRRLRANANVLLTLEDVFLSLHRCVQDRAAGGARTA